MYGLFETKDVVKVSLYALGTYYVVKAAWKEIVRLISYDPSVVSVAATSR
jgi:hypothetical protein